MNDANKNIEQVSLTDLFEDAYASPTELAEVLDLGIEMLFYVEEGSFTRREIQNVAAALRGIGKVLNNSTLIVSKDSR
ncbi:hypothetical protein [Flagellimonas lutimaris]|uniref:hypothetical protein n=1 Tax=Flagellimonas lutimaris TaxID=475082 RepID=UPI003F5CEB21